MKDYHLKLEPLRYFSTDGDGRTCLKKSGKMSQVKKKKMLNETLRGISSLCFSHESIPLKHIFLSMLN